MSEFKFHTGISGYVLAVGAVALSVIGLAVLTPSIIKSYDTSVQASTISAKPRQVESQVPVKLVINDVVYERSDSDALSDTDATTKTKPEKADSDSQSTKVSDIPDKGEVTAPSRVSINGIEYAPAESGDTVAATGGGKRGNTEQNKKKTTNNKYIVTDIDGNMVYLVKKGDTLSGVSKKVSYSVHELAEYNKIKDVNLIYTGEVLRIPD